MKMRAHTLAILIGLLLAPRVMASDSQEIPLMKVYKSETCGCCLHWMAYLEEHQISSEGVHPQNLAGFKEAFGIAPQFQSCHTGVIDDRYVFEGHVPAKHIKQFLESPPSGAIGLSVPGMPVGSPGMEIGDRFDPYTVVQLNADGTSEPFAQISTPSDQF